MNDLLIKICGLTSASNISEVLVQRPDLIGLIFYPPSKRFVVGKLNPEEVIGLEGDVKKVGVFVNAPIGEIQKRIEEYGLDMVQLHGDEAPGLCHEVRESGCEVIKAFGIGEDFDFEQCLEYQSCCKYFLFDTGSSSRGGSGRKFNWELLRNYHLNHPYFLSGGISPGDAPDIRMLNFPGLAGVDLNSRFETAPGIKSIDKLASFIHHIRRTES
jgi:phosphoribosylanthranilate isomerase